MPETEPKPAPVKLRPIQRKNAGRVTEPYSILEKLLSECDNFAPIQHAKILLLWKIDDWPGDKDGVVVGAQCAKASERERLQAEESGGSLDLIIMLPEVSWPNLVDAEKEQRIFHELCHFAPVLDADGKQKKDEKDRWCWRMKRHPIVGFHEEVGRYGADAVLGHNARMIESIDVGDRPLLAQADAVESARKNGQDLDGKSANRLPVAKLFEYGCSVKGVEALEKSKAETVGDVRKEMRAVPDFWHKNLNVVRFRDTIADAVNRCVADACEKEAKKAAAKAESTEPAESTAEAPRLAAGT